MFLSFGKNKQTNKLYCYTKCEFIFIADRLMAISEWERSSAVCWKNIENVSASLIIFYGCLWL